MIPQYSVFLGPGSRLVCISREAVSGNWIVKSGEQGKRLRTATIPLADHDSYDSVQASQVGAGYELQFTGLIDVFGRPIGGDPSVVYWQTKAVDIKEVRCALHELSDEMRSFGVLFTIVDDLAGTWVEISQARFGVIRAQTTGGINFDGNGAGMLSTVSSADLLCLCAVASKSLEISFADVDGKTLTRNQVVERCIHNATDEMSKFVQTKGISSLTTTLRNLSANQPWF